MYTVYCNTCFIFESLLGYLFSDALGVFANPFGLFVSCAFGGSEVKPVARCNPCQTVDLKCPADSGL